MGDQLLVECPEADCAWNILQGFNGIWIIDFVNVRDHIPDLFICF